jgi:tRNA pseudouridine55 synthase
VSESGFLVMDKPVGPTSHDLVAQARRITRVEKVGHAGTLDPLAAGVLVLALGKATRLIRYIQDFSKEYSARVRFGVATTTLDAGGEVVERAPMPITAADLAAVLPEFRGEIEQVPPMVSALKVGGRRLYQLAREGTEVERHPRPVRIEDLDLEEFVPGDFPQARLRVVCSKGTYVRSLADDIARRIGGRAHLEGLTRTRVGPFRIQDAIPPERLGEWRDRLAAPRIAATGMDAMTADEVTEAAVRHGRPLTVAPGEGPLAVCASSGELLAIYRRQGSQARAEVVLG